MDGAGAACGAAELAAPGFVVAVVGVGASHDDGGGAGGDGLREGAVDYAGRFGGGGSFWEDGGGGRDGTGDGVGCYGGLLVEGSASLAGWLMMRMVMGFDLRR